MILTAYPPFCILPFLSIKTFVFSVFACSNRYISEQAVWVDDGVPYKKYPFIEVLPVTSISKVTVRQEILEGI
jgi:hypothetical protein